MRLTIALIKTLFLVGIAFLANPAQAGEYRCRDNVANQSGICTDPIIADTQAYFPYYGENPSPKFPSVTALVDWQNQQLAPACHVGSYVITSTFYRWDWGADYVYSFSFQRSDGSQCGGNLEANVTRPWTCPTGFAMLGSNGAKVPSSDNRFPCFKPDPIIYGGCTAADPVKIFDGAVLERERDYDVPDNRLKVYRNYRSLDGGQGAESIGSKWNLSLTSRVVTPRYGQLFTTYVRQSGEPQFLLQNGSMARSLFDADLLVQAGSGWQYRDDKIKSISEFDASGVQQRQTFKDGVALDYSYSNAATPVDVAPVSGLLISVTDSFGRSVKLKYDAGKFVKSIMDPAGLSINYTLVAAPYFDSLRDLSSATYQDGSSKRYVYLQPAPGLTPQTYPNAALLTSVIDELGISVANFSYLQGISNGTSVWQAKTAQSAGGVDKYTFQAFGAGYAEVTDPLDSIRRYRGAPGGVGDQQKLVESGRDQPGGSGCSPATASMVHYQNGDLYSSDDFNQNRTCHSYYGSTHTELARVEGLSTTIDCSTVTGASASLPPGSRKTSSQWHPDWRLETRVAGPGRLTTLVYNGQPDPLGANAVASCAPTAAVLPDGKPIVVLCRQVEQGTTDTDGHLGFGAALQSGVPDRVQSWAYNQYGQVRTAKGARTDVNDTTTYTYYADTTTDHTMGDLQTVQDALGHATSFNRYNPHGQVLQSTDANSVVTSYTYDLRQRLKSRTVAAGTSQARTSTYTYFPTGLLQRIDLPAGTVSTTVGPGGAQQGRSISYGYDDAHRLTSITSATGEQITYDLDKAGNVKREELKNSLAVGGSANLIRRDFDALGRLWHEIRIINGSDQTTTYGHDANGNPTSTQWPMVAAYGESSAPQEVRRYNALDQLTRIEDAANGVAKPTVLVPDPRDLITSVKAPNNATTGYTLDGFGQTLAESSPDRGTTGASYDAAGNLKTVLDARNVTATWSYDALNRPLGVLYTKAGNTDTADDQSFVWDSNPGGPMPCSNGVGRLCRLTDGSGVSHYAYDVFGNLLQMRRVENGQTTIQSFGYDGEDRLSVLSTNGGRTIALVRDGEGRAGQIVGVVAGGIQQIVKSTDFRADGMSSRASLGNDVVLARTFDNDGLPTAERETLPNSGGSGGGPVDSNDIPTAPEWAMIVLACAFMLTLARRRQRGTMRSAPELALLAAMVLLLLSQQARADETLTEDPRGNVQSRSVDGRASGYTYDPAQPAQVRNRQGQPELRARSERQSHERCRSDLHGAGQR